MSKLKELSYRRVTEIITPFTGIEFVPSHILEKAGTRGTRVHKYIENFLKDSEFLIADDEMEGYINSFERFFQDTHLDLKGSNVTLEKRFYCDDLLITGQVDVMIEKDDTTYLIDWKTSSAYTKHWHLQGAAYKYLCEKNGYRNVEPVQFVKLNKNGKKPTTYKSKDTEAELEIFKKCLELYNFFDMDKTRLKKE